ncbi:MAG: ribosome maturation factor RimP [Micropruina sp.]
MDTRALVEWVSPIVQVSGLEVDRIDVLPAGSRKLVRIFLDGDGPQGRGPSLDQIAQATRAISVALDTYSGLGQQPYTLEVSSRGVGRPLAEPKHYRRNIGRLVALSLAGESITGRIKAVDDDAVTVEVAEVDVMVQLAQVQRAVVQVELNRPADPEDQNLDDEDDDEEDEDADEEE